jgi:hypothetical protein
VFSNGLMASSLPSLSSLAAVVCFVVGLALDLVLIPFFGAWAQRQLRAARTSPEGSATLALPQACVPSAGTCRSQPGGRCCGPLLAPRAPASTEGAEPVINSPRSNRRVSAARLGAAARAAHRRPAVRQRSARSRGQSQPSSSA